MLFLYLHNAIVNQDMIDDDMILLKKNTVSISVSIHIYEKMLL